MQSEGRFHLADHGRDEGLIGISIKNQSTADAKNYSLEIEVSFYFILLALGFGFQRPAAIYFPRRSGAGSDCKTAGNKTLLVSVVLSKGAVRQPPCGVTDRQRKAPTGVLCRAATNKASVFLVECVNFKRHKTAHMMLI